MTEEQTRSRITELQGTLTGNLFTDGEVQQEIYDMKKSLMPEIEENPELDDFGGECLSCGA
ncbi:MAG: hypothetical protein ACJAZ2_001860 [Glaciecola sp.]|jgi:hypothetical protein